MKTVEATEEDVERIKAAAADNHPAFAPTHFLQDSDGNVRGYCSVGGMTCVLFWSHTGNSPRNSILFVKESQRLARETGKPVFYTCSAASPFVPLMPRFGFEKIGNADFWLLKG